MGVEGLLSLVLNMNAKLRNHKKKWGNHWKLTSFEDMVISDHVTHAIDSIGSSCLKHHCGETTILNAFLEFT